MRTDLIEDLAAGTWELAPWTWRDTTKLELLIPGAYFSVSLFLPELAAADLPGWYVDFIRPCLPGAPITPDGSLRWKDEAEYAQARRLGIVTAADHAHVRRAREQVVGLFGQRAAPFDERWQAWRPDPSWPLPSLPADAKVWQEV